MPAASARGGTAIALAYLRHKVTARIQALRTAQPRSRWKAALPAAALASVTALALADAAAALGPFLDVTRDQGVRACA